MQVRARRPGFTLIELLIVVVIIGILAALAIPKFAHTKERTYIGEMKSDLRNLSVAEEGYFFENRAYVTDLSKFVGYKPSPGVTITMRTADATGWSATAKHASIPNRTCYLFVGAAPHGPNGPATVAGQVVCE